jgi:hypothetical protein
MKSTSQVEGEPVRLSFGHYGPLDQRDGRTGDRILSDRASETWGIMNVTLDFRGMSQDFLVEGKIREKGFPSEKLERKLKASVVSGVPQRKVWDLFRITEFWITPQSSEFDGGSAECIADGILATRLEEQMKHGTRAMNAWASAVACMKEGLQDGYEFNQRNVWDAFSSIESFHRAANNGMMHSWCEEKLSLIRSGLKELDKKKNRSHPNYMTTIARISGYLSAWPINNSWISVPPVKS